MHARFLVFTLLSLDYRMVYQMLLNTVESVTSCRIKICHVLMVMHERSHECIDLSPPPRTNKTPEGFVAIYLVS